MRRFAKEAEKDLDDPLRNSDLDIMCTFARSLSTNKKQPRLKIASLPERGESGGEKDRRNRPVHQILCTKYAEDLHNEGMAFPGVSPSRGSRAKGRGP